MISGYAPANQPGSSEKQDGVSMIQGSYITKDGVRLSWDEYGSGDRIIISAMAGRFYPFGLQQALSEKGYRVFCMTLRGFSPSDYITRDYGDAWYDVFADDVAGLADHLGIRQFFYLGASHGAGVGWHLLWRHSDRIKAFVAAVPGPHSLDAGTMSYRQMLLQGIISSPPPFDPPAGGDPAREARRQRRQLWLSSLPEADPREKAIDYGRPLMRCGSEEKLRELLSSFRTPVLILGGTEDPISTPELMTRTAKALPHCKMIVWSGCGHNIDTDFPEELAAEADRFLSAHE